MIKISALNENCELEVHSEGEVTREALEQIALREYAKALELHRKGNVSDTAQLLKDLLNTELLSTVEKPAKCEKITNPLFNLKYLCYRNLASVLSASGEIEGAIEAYCSASELDDTDVTLWHRLGLVCLCGKHYEMALHAFRRGIELNPKHWPCLDKIVTLLLGLDYKEDCISTIYESLQLDPGYLRGLVYRRHIYLNYPYVRDFMKYLNPIYKWNEGDDDLMDNDQSEKLLKEAEDIHNSYLSQQRTEQFKYFLPNLKLKKPIRKFTWESVGESLIFMHHYMTENYYSHACHIEIVIKKDENKDTMELSKEAKYNETEGNDISLPVNQNINMVDKNKQAIDIEKEYCKDNEVNNREMEKAPEPKRKAPIRRKDTDLSFLKQWEWCTKRRSSRKKKVVENDCLNDNIYDTLYKMVPANLLSEVVQSNEKSKEDITSLAGMFEVDQEKIKDNEYFGTDKEQKDVQLFINKYTENKSDIIDMLNGYLSILAKKWKFKWPKNLSNIFIQASKCYNNHIDVPLHTDDNREELLHYINVNLLVEELTVNKKLQLSTSDMQVHDLCVVESIGMALTSNPYIFTSTDIIEFILRYLWVKLHIHLLNKSEELGLDCLYQLSSELDAIKEPHGRYLLEVVQFTFKPVINKEEVSLYIKFLEINKKLSTVMDLYNKGSYNEVLPIVLDSFQYCKDMTGYQENKISLHFAVQLFLILDTYWALDDVEICFKWSFICLHEALKHYFQQTSGSTDYDKWTLTVVKILCCMEHIIKMEGLSCLDTISREDLSQGLKDLIRIIGHQVGTNSEKMPFDTVAPWIIMHYILQREEDQGGGKTFHSELTCDAVSNALMVLFIAHEQLGSRGWCCNSKGKLLYFILDTVVPRLRSPLLSKCLKDICQHVEQCIYCLFKHPARKNMLKYLVDHNATEYTLDWMRAQQVYEIFRPPALPELEGKVTCITADTVQLFQRILKLIPSECDPRKYVPEMEKYIQGVKSKLPSIPSLLPYKMKDIYFLLGDYFFKKEAREMVIEFNMLDVIVNNKRFESWAEISLVKALNVQRLLNSCENLNNEREILTPARSIIRCFERSLKLDPKHCNLWIEYGIFAYTIHSFCSRLLKQGSESLSMDSFEFLDKQKEDMLDATEKCFMTALRYMNNSINLEKGNEDSWLPYYMLGKVAEKRNKPLSVYLNYYMQGLKSLEETDATYPLKINYNSPTHLCIEVLELHYRIHASILKYIEQNEDKPIPISLGKLFATCIEEWKKSPFMNNAKKDGNIDSDPEVRTKEPLHVENIYERSKTKMEKDDTCKPKRIKLEAATARVTKSASSDKGIIMSTYSQTKTVSQTTKVSKVDKKTDSMQNRLEPATMAILLRNIPNANKINKCIDKSSNEVEKLKYSSGIILSSSSDSSSSESSSDKTDNSSGQDSDKSKKSNVSKMLPEEEITKITLACLEALEDCASRFPPHYKAIFRLAHYHLYSNKGKDIKKCRDLMLSNFFLRSGQKLGGLFCDRKSLNFFNNIWKIPSSEVDRAGGFAFHMNRSVLLTMEILKETDDHKTLLDLSLYLQKVPEPDKKYLKDSNRRELSQQGLNLCIQSFKAKLFRFNQQINLENNDAKKEILMNLMLDIYAAYQKTQKNHNSIAKQFINFLVDAYKLVTTVPLTKNLNIVELSMKYCQVRKNVQKKKTALIAETANVAMSLDTLLKPETKNPSASTSKLPKISSHEQGVTFKSNLPSLKEQELVRENTSTATHPRWINLTTIAEFNHANQQTIQNILQCPIQNQNQSMEYSQKSLGQIVPSSNTQVLKKGPKTNTTNKSAPIAKASRLKASKSFSATSKSVSKSCKSVVTKLQKFTSTPLAPSKKTVLSTLPPSMAANLAVLGTSVHASYSNLNVHSLLPSRKQVPSTSSVNTDIQTHQKTRFSEHQKNLTFTSKSLKDINASISKLPSSVTITKTSVLKQGGSQLNKDNTKKCFPLVSVAEKGVKPKQTSSNEVIVLDDD